MLKNKQEVDLFMIDNSVLVTSYGY